MGARPWVILAAIALARHWVWLSVSDRRIARPRPDAAIPAGLCHARHVDRLFMLLGGFLALPLGCSPAGSATGWCSAPASA